MSRHLVLVMSCAKSCVNGLFRSLLFLLLLPVAPVLGQQQPADVSPGSPQSTAPQSTDPQSTTPASPSPASPDAQAETAPKPEISQRDTGTTFKVRVNFVQVRVVVRDKSGNPVPDLQREDFELYDNNKLQSVSTFDVENAKTRRARAEAAAKTQEATPGVTEAQKIGLPERFIALDFDDGHLNMQDAVYARSTAIKFIDAIAPTDRVGIYTTSGHVTQEFTNDKEALHRALQSIIPTQLFDPSTGRPDCPQITHYMADAIENKHDSQALAVAAEETVQCAFYGDETKLSMATNLARTAAIHALNVGDTQNIYVYRHLEDVLRRLSAMPGERVMLLVSPGFILSTQFLDEMEVVDKANRGGIVINTLDARGLYVPDLAGDISQRNSDTFKTAGYKATYRVAAQFEQTYPLRDIADGTGGTFFHNSNDLEGGLKRAGAAPEISYVLGFSPQSLKLNGSFHILKVNVTGKRKYDVQARRGYYAPRKAEDPAQQARQEIQQAIYSQDEILDLPLQLQTQFFKKDQTGVRLSVVSRLELKDIRFRASDGRKVDDLTVATIIFDENGNYVTGGEKSLQMHLRDSTYEQLAKTGLTVKSTFDVKPGKYLIRQVVRDTEGAQMAARNGAVDIPY
jgi:VWFA-related protein